jgi:hypothetical protein
MKFDVFLSHSEEDYPVLISQVKDLLTRTKINAYIYQAFQKPGGSLIDMVADAIRDSSIVVVFLTRNSVNSPWVNQEIGLAHGLGKTIIPVVEENLTYSGLIIFKVRLGFSVSDPMTMMYQLLRRLRELLSRCEQENNGLLVKCSHCNELFETILPSCQNLEQGIEKGSVLQCLCPHCKNDIYVNPFTFDQTGIKL